MRLKLKYAALPALSYWDQCAVGLDSSPSNACTNRLPTRYSQVQSLVSGKGPTRSDAPQLTSHSGLTAFTSSAHIARATLEAMAYQTCAVLDVIEQEIGIRLETLNVDGELSAMICLT